MRSIKVDFRIVAIVMLVAAALACNVEESSDTELTETPTEVTDDEGDEDGDFTATPTEEVADADSDATDEPTEEATEEDGPTLTPTACTTYDADFIDDITIPDGQQFSPGVGFTKTWQMKSTGCVAWPTGTKLIFVSGDQMGGPASVDVLSAAPLQEIHVSVNLTAPASPGQYQGNWKLQAPGGAQFGPTIYVKIEVVENTPVPSADKPDLIIESLTISPSIVLAEKTMTAKAVVKNVGTAQAPASKMGGELVGAGAGGELNVGVLAPGASQVVEFGFTMDPGTYTVRATADIPGAVDESNEGNNVKEKTFTVHDWATYTTKQFTIQEYQCVDLDNGTLYADCNLSVNDFTWYKNTGGGIIQYWLIPKNGAKFAVYGSGTPDIVACMNAPLSSSQIDGGQYKSSTSTYTPADMPVGTYVCYQTSDGRYGSFRVNELLNYGNAMKFGYTTWNIN